MRVGSVCSGIEAASKAWMPLGWKFSFLSEIDDFPRAVLTERHPDIPLHGDFTTINRGDYADIDVLIGGTPCFTGNTMVTTSLGQVPIKDVKVDDSVLTHAGKWQKVLAIGSKQAATVVAKGHGSCGIRTTPEHPFWAMEKQAVRIPDSKSVHRCFMGDPRWVEAKDMHGKFWGISSVADSLMSVAPSKAGNESMIPVLNKHLMFIAGAYLGNGWTRIDKRRGVAIFGMGQRDHSRLEEAIKGCGLNFSKSSERTTFKYNVSSRPLARWLKENFGSGAKDKSIPSWAIFGLDREMRNALFEGYIYTDGSPSMYKKVPNGWRILTVSRKLAVSAKILGSTLGYSVSERHTRPEPTKVIEGRTVNQSDTGACRSMPTAGRLAGVMELFGRSASR